MSISQWSLKFKIILAVFGIIVVIIAIQSALTLVNTEKKRENFENDEKPNYKRAGATTDDKAKPTDKDIKLNILDTVETVFDKYYTHSPEKKSMVYDMLLRKDSLDEIKSKQEKGRDVSKVVMDMIKSKMNDISGITNIDKDHFENPDKETLDKVLKNIDKNLNYEIVNNHLEEISAKVKEIQMELKRTHNKAEVSDTKYDKPTEPPPRSVEKPTSKPPGKGDDTIEGFEQRINYAIY